MPAGWNQTSGTFREGPIDENTFWMLFNYVFSEACAKRSTYKFGLIKSILDNILSVIYNERLVGIPMILETPYVDKEYPPYKQEIRMIKNKKFNENLLDDVRRNI